MKRMGRLELSMRKLLAPPHNQSTERVGTPGHIPSPLITFLPPTEPPHAIPWLSLVSVYSLYAVRLSSDDSPEH
jgi:hypothetical protein